MTRFFISRPIFASVISIVVVIAGLLASLTLPVAQYPEITPPTVVISATYPGANAETLSKTVAAPIEEQLSGVEGLLYFNSTSASTGAVTITVTFQVGTDPDTALIAVNNRVKVAEPRLPDEVRRTGVLVQKRSNNMLLLIALRSPGGQHESLFLSNYLATNVVEEIRRIPGVGAAEQFDPQYAMRIWLKPDVMARLGVTTSDVTAAVRAQNTQNAAGKIGQEPILGNQQLSYTVSAKGRLLTPEEFAMIIVRADGPGGVVRLKDVARVELGGEHYDRSAAVNGKPVSAMAVYLQSGANALSTAKVVKARMDELQKRFPKDMEYFIPYDTTRFIQASAHEVVVTLVEAALLVLVVVYVFLQSWRATLIPMVAVPISLIGTFAGLWLFGFSINTLTLFALVLSIGIVVDDAIVVLENVERLMREKKLSPRAAAIEAMREVSGAVVAIVLVLCAVFIPVAFLGGIAGKMYQQFAVTVAVSVVISGMVALTLTPSLCALMLKRTHETPAFFRAFNRGFEGITRFYTDLVGRILANNALGALVFAAVVGAVALLIRVVPGSFVPPEDQGYLFGFVTLTDGASAHRTQATAEQFRGTIMSDDIENIFFISGMDFITGNNRPSVATTFIVFKPWEERTVTADEMAHKFTGVGMGLPDGLGMVFNPPPIDGLGTAGGFEVYLQNRADGDPARLAQVANELVAALAKRPELGSVNSFFRVTSPQLQVDVDEAKALSMGISLESIYATLQATLGSLYVNDFNRAGKTYKVQLQADAAYRMSPEDILKPHVRSATGAMVPLSAVARVRTLTGPEMVERFNGFVSAKIMGSAAPGHSSGEAIAAVEAMGAQILPEGFQLEWVGQAFQEKRSGFASVVAFAFGIIMVFLILAAQFEKWSLPLVVVMAVPFALLGALVAVLIRDMPNDIYFQIGLVVLVGLAAKNAILIVEFASQKMEEGLSTLEAAKEAARLRFRPIVMTSLAFVLGVLPLAISTGAGAGARRSMGTGVVGGMLAATFIATLFVPLFFKWLARGKQAIPQETLAIGQKQNNR
ncbi:MAG: multidrug efflux RND transporter permease subunit [Rhodocyclaceae bacterium]|jgi:HAE1 family hydrophobic/amphiphilic exporter-1/multidrug efflux pump|nr:multidrug efflux RND transporter permease subunit [Rhodocyclaceae bacterium]